MAFAIGLNRVQETAVQRLGPSVVLVEDDQGMRQAAERVLMASGLQTASFASAEDALGSDLGSAGIFVLDVHLPGMSGFDLCEKLLERGNGKSFIFITANDNEATRQRARRLGAIAYLPKPFSGRELARLVIAALTRRGKLQ